MNAEKVQQIVDFSKKYLKLIWCSFNCNERVEISQMGGVLSNNDISSLLTQKIIFIGIKENLQKFKKSRSYMMNFKLK